MDASEDFSKTQQAISDALVKTTRSVTRVSSEDISFHRSSDAAVGPLVDEQNARLLGLAEKLLRRAAHGNSVGRHEGLALADTEAIDTNWSSIVDVVDGLLERVDRSLDEYTGLVKRASPSSQPQSPGPKERPARRNVQFRPQNLAKPQLLFDQKPRNHETQPFKPFLTSKPHGLIPLEQSLGTSPNQHETIQYQHPYQVEIERFQYPQRIYTSAEPLPYHPFASTKATFVDDWDGVMSMLQELKSASEIAVDLEHHEVHSYIGIVSLMQISTRDRDWVVDTLKPWRQNLQVLNEVFADPEIVKVLHGAHMDIIWLQRDLGIYVVGLFDTHHAARVLGYAGGSLAFLLKKFVDFDAQKQYQTADWRIRPLPEEMFDYARSDTHFLLYIFDCMRNDLIEKSNFSVADEDRIQAVLERSQETALQRYEHPIYNEETGLGKSGWFNLLQKTPSLLSKEQFAVFRKVHHWRDSLARTEDESPFHIMPNHVLFNIARSMPHTTAALLSVSHPVSAAMRQRTDEILKVIREAKADSVNGPEVQEVLLRHLDPFHASLRGAGQATTTPDAGAAAGTPVNRLESSQFWGATLTLPEQLPVVNGAQQSDKEFTLPFPSGAVEGVASVEHELQRGFEEKIGVATDTPTPSPAPASGHSGSAKRKLAAFSTSDQSSAASRPIRAAGERDTRDAEHAHEAATDEIKLRAESRSAKRAGNKARHLNRSEGNVNGRDDGEGERPAFDYDAAPSVLHAPKDMAAERATRAKAFNPYAKAADAPAGLKKARGPQVGKSATFKR